MLKPLSVLCLSALASTLIASEKPQRSPAPPKEMVVALSRAQDRLVLASDTMGVLKLPVVPATGYRWEVLNAAEVSPSVRVLALQSEDGAPLPEFEEPDPSNRAPGRALTQIIRVVGMQAADAELKLVYRRPWEAGYQEMKRVTVSSQGAWAQPLVLPRASNAKAYLPPPKSETAAAGLPAHWDWREHNGVTPVKNQKQCGSCWAFGTTAALESKILIKTGVVRDYAEQYLVSCNQDGWSCSGGWWGHDYYTNKSMLTESGAGGRMEGDFPYVAINAPCNGPHTPYEQLEGWAYVDDIPDTAAPRKDHHPTVAQIKQKIFDYGPVGTCVDATHWGSYKGGVWKESGSTSTDHIVLITGWDDTEGCFYIKNSWGTSWGESGYMRLAYGTDLVGESSTYVLRESTVPEVMYRSSTFREGKANDGSIGNSIDVYLNNDTADTRFAVTSGTMTAGTHYTLANLPAGLTAQVQALSATTARITLSGKAAAHASANSLTNLSLTFLDAAFTGKQAAAVANASAHALNLSFNDPYQFIYRDVADTTCDANNGWKVWWLDGSNYSYEFGLWWYGVNSSWKDDPANNTIKLETYTNLALSTGATAPGNLIPLNYGDPVGPASKTWAPGGSYGDQHTITGPSYGAWNGKSAYVGFTFQYQGYPVYGWMQIKVGADGKSATLVDYGWDQDPNHIVRAGYHNAVTNEVGLTITSPKAGSAWGQGSTHAITWDANKVSNVKVDLLKGGSLASTLSPSSPATDGSFAWNVPATLALGNDYAIRVGSLDDGGSTTSTSGAFSITGSTEAPFITTQPSNQSAAPGQTATFSVSVSGTAPFTYQWFKNNATLSGATSSSYTTPALSAADDKSTFKVTVTNAAGNATSNSATLSVGTVTVTPNLAQAGLLTGTSAAFSATVSGASNGSVNWSASGGSLLPSGNSASFSADTPGTYTLRAASSADPTKIATISVNVHNADYSNPGHGVTGMDSLYLIGKFGSHDLAFDLNGDGNVDDSDLALLLNLLRW